MKRRWSTPGVFHQPKGSKDQMSKIAGFSNGRHPYFKFEYKMTLELDKLFQNETDPDIKEMTRLHILKTRIWCRDYWTATGGKEIPPNVTFSEI